MNLERQASFTIIEVTLFLAVSGLLFLLIFIGTGSTLRATRFTDSIRSTQSYLQQQADEILNGVNPRSAALACNSIDGVTNGTPQSPGTSGCLLLGKMLYFHNNVIDTYYVVGTSIPDLNGASGSSDEELILSAKPVLVKNTLTPFTIPWQVMVSGGLVKDTAVEADTITILRSPRSSQLFTYASDNGASFFAGANNVDIRPMLATGGVNPRSYVNAPTTYCFDYDSAGSQLAAITMSSNKNSDGSDNGQQKAENAVTAQFDVAQRINVCIASGG